MPEVVPSMIELTESLAATKAALVDANERARREQSRAQEAVRQGSASQEAAALARHSSANWTALRRLSIQTSPDLEAAPLGLLGEVEGLRSEVMARRHLEQTLRQRSAVLRSSLMLARQGAKLDKAECTAKVQQSVSDLHDAEARAALLAELLSEARASSASEWRSRAAVLLAENQKLKEREAAVEAREAALAGERRNLEKRHAKDTRKVGVLTNKVRHLTLQLQGARRSVAQEEQRAQELKTKLAKRALRPPAAAPAASQRPKSADPVRSGRAFRSPNTTISSLHEVSTSSPPKRRAPYAELSPEARTPRQVPVPHAVPPEYVANLQEQVHYLERKLETASAFFHFGVDDISAHTPHSSAARTEAWPSSLGGSVGPTADVLAC